MAPGQFDADRCDDSGRSTDDLVLVDAQTAQTKIMALDRDLRAVERARDRFHGESRIASDEHGGAAVEAGERV